MTSNDGGADPSDLDHPSAEVAAPLELTEKGGWQWERLASESAAAHALRRVDNAIGVAEAAMLAFLIATLVIIGTAQAIAGNLFHTSLGGATELLRYSVFFIAMLGAALAAQRKRLIAMDVFARFLSPEKRAVLGILLACFTLSMCVLLVVGSLNLYEVAKGEHYQVVPPGIGLLAFPVGVALVGFHIALHAVIDFLHLRTGAISEKH